MSLYTFVKSATSDTIHIFEGRVQPNEECLKRRESMCGALALKEGEILSQASCMFEDEARQFAANRVRARKVCGKCVAQLYY